MELMHQSSKFVVLTKVITWFFVVRCVSSITPRVSKDWENMTFEVPTVVRESGMGRTWTFSERTQSLLVLSSFSFSLLLDIHTLTLWMHSCMDSTSSLTWFGGADFLSCMSSVNEWWWIEWRSVTSEGCGIEDKQNRPQDRTPRHTVRNGSGIRL